VAVAPNENPVEGAFDFDSAAAAVLVLPAAVVVPNDKGGLSSFLSPTADVDVDAAVVGGALKVNPFPWFAAAIGATGAAVEEGAPKLNDVAGAAVEALALTAAVLLLLSFSFGKDKEAPNEKPPPPPAAAGAAAAGAAAGVDDVDSAAGVELKLKADDVLLPSFDDAAAAPVAVVVLPPANENPATGAAVVVVVEGAAALAGVAGAAPNENPVTAGAAVFDVTGAAVAVLVVVELAVVAVAAVEVEVAPKLNPVEGAGVEAAVEPNEKLGAGAAPPPAGAVPKLKLIMIEIDSIDRIQRFR